MQLKLTLDSAMLFNLELSDISKTYTTLYEIKTEYSNLLSSGNIRKVLFKTKI